MSEELKRKLGRDQEVRDRSRVDPREDQVQHIQQHNVTMSTGALPLSTTVPQSALPLPEWHQQSLQHSVPPVLHNSPAAATSPPASGPYQYPPYPPYPYPPGPGYYPYPPPPHLPSHVPPTHPPPPQTHIEHNSRAYNEHTSPTHAQAARSANQPTMPPTSNPPPNVPYQYPYYGHYHHPYPPPPYYGAPYAPNYVSSQPANSPTDSHLYHDERASLETDPYGSSSGRSTTRTRNDDITEDEKIRDEKNNQARIKERELKRRMRQISTKKQHDKTEEEIKVFNLFEQRRQRKNKRSRDRTREKKEEMNRILKIPEKDRTEEEKRWITVFLVSKKRKNEGDRQRRERLKSLGLSSSRSSVTSTQSQDLSYADADQVAYSTSFTDHNSKQGAVPTTIHTSTLQSQEKIPPNKAGQLEGHREQKKPYIIQSNQVTYLDQSRQQGQINVANPSNNTSASRSLTPNILEQLGNVIESPLRGSELGDSASFFTSSTPTPITTDTEIMRGVDSLEVPSLHITHFSPPRNQTQQLNARSSMERTRRRSGSSRPNLTEGQHQNQANYPRGGENM